MSGAELGPKDLERIADEHGPAEAEARSAALYRARWGRWPEGLSVRAAERLRLAVCCLADGHGTPVYMDEHGREQTLQKRSGPFVAPPYHVCEPNPVECPICHGDGTGHTDPLAHTVDCCFHTDDRPAARRACDCGRP